jgi:hypothetical protein
MLGIHHVIDPIPPDNHQAATWQATSNAQGTVLDSRTTLSYLADGIYDTVISDMS